MEWGTCIKGHKWGDFANGMELDLSLTLAQCAIKPIVCDTLLVHSKVGVSRRVQFMNEALFHINNDGPTFVVLLS